MTRQFKRRHSYLWEGKDKHGTHITGEMLAISPAKIHAKLLRQNIEPVKIKKKSKPLFTYDQKIKPLDITLFMRHLSILISAGIPLLKALNSIQASSVKSKLQILLLSIQEDIKQGRSLADSLSKHPHYFNNLISNMIRTAELSGTLDLTLKSIADYLEKSASLKKKVHKALAYPMIILSVSIVVATILLLFIVPQFQSLFNSFGAQLPLSTRFIIHCSTILREYGWVIITLLGIGISVAKTANKHSIRFNYFVDKLKLRMVIMGPLIEKAILARTMRTLATTLAAGIPLVDALTSVSYTANNSVYQQALTDIRNAVTNGQSLHCAMNDTGRFPSIVIQMVAVGEETGAIETLLTKIADYYEEDVNTILSNLSNLIEPIIMLLLSIIVGSFVIAMYMPIFKLGSVFTH